MRLRDLSAYLSVLVLATSCCCRSYEPMVAFVCGKGAMHMDQVTGWTADATINCTERRDAVLDYCKQMYPTLNISNIVETSDLVEVKGWCPVGQSDCLERETLRVKPYRCLSGPFLSDALVVPHKCLFDHIHNGDQCQEYSWWEDVAQKSCVGLHSMRLESSGMLLPCGTDMFTGVEFVCCPPAAGSTVPSIAVELVTTPSVTTPSVPVADKRTDNDIVRSYLHQASKSEYATEHDAFMLAKKQLLKDNHDKITKLMKEWAEARNQVIEMKATDPKGAEKLNEEITSRFQKEYYAYQSEGEENAQQLDTMHQRHVQTNFNAKKKKIMQLLIDELQAEFYEPVDILTYLQKYISTEQKDAHHSITHYLKIKSRDQLAANQMLPTVIEHLTLISTRINQSIDLLKQLEDDKISAKIATSVRAWLKVTFTDLDKTIEGLSNNTWARPTTAAPGDSSEDMDEVDDVHSNLQAAETDEEELSSVGDKAASNASTMYKAIAEKLAKTDFVKSAKSAEISDEESSVEDEHKYSTESAVAHLAKGEINAELHNIDEVPSAVNTGISVMAVAATAIGVILATMLVVFAIVIVRRQGRRRGLLSNTYLEVAADSPDLSPEDRHIIAMQHGFENPTYKMLEQKKV